MLVLATGVLRALARILFWYCAVVLFVLFLVSCTVLDFSCSTGQYGPRASVTTAMGHDVDAEFLGELSRLCSADV